MPDLELECHPAAHDEVVGAFEWYNQIDTQVAEKFKLELDRAEKLILRAPAAWGRTAPECTFHTCIVGLVGPLAS